MTIQTRSQRNGVVFVSQVAGEEERLREHPSTRFDFQEKLYNLSELSEEIRQEDLSEPHVKQGHRQIALLKDQPVTLALYCFEKDGRLVDHRVDGVTTLQVLDGTLRVETENDTHELSRDDMLILNKDVEHNVLAREKSRMILTICWDGAVRK